MKIKLTMKCHIIPIWLAKVKEKDSIMSRQKCGDRGILTHSWRECEQCGRLRTVWSDLVEFSVQTPKSSANPTMVTQARRNSHLGHKKILTGCSLHSRYADTKWWCSFPWVAGESYVVGGKLGNGKYSALSEKKGVRSICSSISRSQKRCWERRTRARKRKPKTISAIYTKLHAPYVFERCKYVWMAWRWVWGHTTRMCVNVGKRRGIRVGNGGSKESLQRGSLHTQFCAPGPPLSKKSRYPHVKFPGTMLRDDRDQI